MAYTSHWSPGTYPAARRSSHVDEYKSAKQGTVRVSDPYEWLERDTPETQTWVTDQEAYTRAFLDKNLQRSQLEDSIRASTDYERFGHPSLKADNRWYWSYNSGLQAQSVYYRSKDATLPSFNNGETGSGGEVFFDPNVLSEDGTVSLATAAFSRDGKYFAYALSRSVRPLSAPFAPIIMLTMHLSSCVPYLSHCTPAPTSDSHVASHRLTTPHKPIGQRLYDDLRPADNRPADVR